MADCCDVFKMVDEGDSFQSWNGLRGPYYIPHLSADGVLSWTNTGSLPNPQPVDISGPPGSSVELRGPVASVQDLPATASSSELWLVGTASPYDGYFFNGVRWENAGQIAVGPTGPQGPAGQDGTDGTDGVTFTPTVSSAGVISWTNDGGLPNPESVNIKGPAGQDGTNGQDGAPGAAAGFGTPTATVDGNVGTPSVTVTASGPDTAKVFAFAFSNLKGEPGSGSSIDPYTSNPADLAASASPGSASQYSRGDHVHKLPSASDIGAYVKPAGGIPASDLASGVIPTVPTAYTSSPEMDGTASPGSSTAWAKGDHVHPHDTSKQDTLGSGDISATLIADGAVTRQKLANDALYSPLSQITNANYSIVATDIGKTICPEYSALHGVNVTVTLPQDTSALLPNGTEIAFFWKDSSYFHLAFSGGIKTAKAGDEAYSQNVVYNFPDRFSIVGIKKIGSSSQGDWWIIQGNVEVVT